MVLKENFNTIKATITKYFFMAFAIKTSFFIIIRKEKRWDWNKGWAIAHEFYRKITPRWPWQEKHLTQGHWYLRGFRG
jgi:hypothetical protein